MNRRIQIRVAPRRPHPLRGLRGLGTLDPNSQMTIGGNYVFHFKCGLLGTSVGCPDLQSVADAVRTDSNFKNPVAGFDTNSGILVSFTYAGLGSNILNAGLEMAQVIQSNISGYARFAFVSADGPSPAAQSSTPGAPAPQNNTGTQNNQGNNGGGLSYPGGQDPGGQDPNPQGTSWAVYALTGVGLIVGAKVVMGFFQ